MATDLHPARPTLKPPAAGKYESFVVAQLGQARQRIRLLDVAAAAAGFLILSLGYGLIMALLDRALDLPSAARQVAFGIYGIGAGVYLGLALIRPLLRGINPYYAARRLEQTMPEAKNSVVNWLDLHDESIPAAFRSAIGQRAAKDLAHADLEQAISARRASWLGGGALALFFVLLILFLLGPRQFLSLLHRAFAPFVETSIATRTRLTLVRPEQGDATVTIGQAVNFAVLVDGRVPDPGRPDAVRLLYRYNPADLFETRAFERNDSTGEWITSLAPAEVRTGFWYKLAGGDAETDEYHVLVRSTPLLSGFDVTYHYRPYLGWADRSTQDPNLKALRGTEVTLVARANRAIKEGELAVTGEKAIAAELVPGDAQAMRFHLVIDKDGVYRVWFTSVDGERNTEPMPYTIQALQDQAPQVELKKPGDVDRPPNGVVEVEGAASDDFGVTGMTLRMKRGNGVTLQSKPYRPQKSFRRDNGSYPQMLDYKDFVELDKIKQEDGVALKEPLKPGEVIEYWLEAKDNCDYPGPNFGESKHFKITIQDTKTDKKTQEQQRSQAQQEKQKHDQTQDEKLQQNQEQQQTDKQQGNQGDKQQEKSEQGKSEQQQKPEKGEQQKSNEQQAKPNEAGGEKDQQRQPQANDSGNTSEDQKVEQQRDKLEQAIQKQQQSKPQNKDQQQKENQQGDPQNGPGNSQQQTGKDQQQPNKQENGVQPHNQEKQQGKNESGSKPSDQGGNGQNANDTQPKNGQRPDQPEEKQTGGGEGAQQEKKQQDSAEPKHGADQKEPDKTGDKNSENKQGNAGNQQSGAGEKNGKNSETGAQNAREKNGSQAKPDGQKPSEKPQQEKQNSRRGSGTESPKTGTGTSGQENGNKDQKPADLSGANSRQGKESSSPEKGGQADQKNRPKDDGKGGRQAGESAGPENQQSKEKPAGAAGDRKQEQAVGKQKPEQGDSAKPGTEKNSQRSTGDKSNAEQSGNQGAKPMPDSKSAGQQGKDDGKPKAGDGAKPGEEKSGDKTPNGGEKQGAQNTDAKNGSRAEKKNESGSTQSGSDQDREAARKKLEELAKALGSSDPKTRQEAERKLQELAQKSGDSKERQAAAEALKQAGKEPGSKGGQQQGKKETGTRNGKPSGEPKGSPEHKDGNSQQGKPGGQDSGNAPGKQEPADRSSQEQGKPGENGGTKSANGKAPPQNQPGSNPSNGSDRQRGTGGGSTSGEKPTPHGQRSTGPLNDLNNVPPEPPAERGSPADAAARKRAADLQLEDLRKRVNKDVLKEAKMSEKEFDDFLKAYKEMLNRKAKTPVEAEKPADPLQGDRRGRPNVGARRVEAVGPQKAGNAQRFGNIGPPPEFAEPYQEFSKKLSDMEREPAKK
jgi:collagen type III alpha